MNLQSSPSQCIRLLRANRKSQKIGFWNLKHDEFVIELDDGKIYRKPLYLMVKNHGFRLRFSLKPIHWIWWKKKSMQGASRDHLCVVSFSNWTIQLPLNTIPHCQEGEQWPASKQTLLLIALQWILRFLRDSVESCGIRWISKVRSNQASMVHRQWFIDVHHIPMVYLARRPSLTRCPLSAPKSRC